MKKLNLNFLGTNEILTREQMKMMVGGVGEEPDGPVGDGTSIDGDGCPGPGYKCCYQSNCSKCNPCATKETHHCPQSYAVMTAC